MAYKKAHMIIDKFVAHRRIETGVHGTDIQIKDI